jgi:radical SAM superfamily enzyme YgiQ (UPF0313 family)
MKTTIISISPEISPLGAGNLTTYLRHHGYSATLLFLIAAHKIPLEESVEDNIISFLEETKPDVLGFSVMTIFYNTIKKLSAKIRKEIPTIKIIWGGIHPTIRPDECLDYCDFVCRGEGEEPLLDLISRLDKGEEYHDIPNLSQSKNGEIHHNEIRPLCQDLDQLPFPVFDWENTYLIHTESVIPLTKDIINRYRPKKGTVYGVMPSRGCPFNCSFCCNSTYKYLYRGKGKMLRYRSAENVIAELEYAINEFPAVRGVNFEDDALGSAPEKYLEEFCKIYKERIDLPFQIRILPLAKVKEKKIKMLKSAGLVGVAMGLQGSDKMNKEVYNRPTTQKTFIDLAKMLHRNRIIGKYDLIIDNPYSNEDDEIEAIQTFMEIPKPYNLRVFSLAFFPLTELSARALKDGILDPKACGYEEIYGSGTHLYPPLAKLAEMTPFTPRFLIALFLSVRKSPIGRGSLWLYYRSIFKVQRKIIDFVLQNPRYILLLRNLVLKAKGKQLDQVN